METAVSTNRSRTRFIDIARCIGIVAIILGHLSEPAIQRVVYTFNVPLFFLITGYFINEKNPDLKFIRRKFRTLIVPYLITGAALVIIAVIGAAASKGDVIGQGKLWLYAVVYGSGYNWYEPFFISSVGPVWFLCATFFSGILLKLLLKTKPIIRMLAVVTLFAIGYFSSFILWLPLSIQAGFCGTLYVYLGYLFSKCRGTAKELNKESKIFFILIAFAVWISFIAGFKSYWMVICDFGRGVIDIFGSVCACISVFVISYLIDRYMKHSSKLLSYIGENSIFIVCVHTIEQDLLAFDSRLEHLFPGLTGIPGLILLIVVKLVFNITLGCLLSRIRFVRKAFGMKQ